MNGNVGYTYTLTAEVDAYGDIPNPLYPTENWIEPGYGPDTPYIITAYVVGKDTENEDTYVVNPTRPHLQTDLRPYIVNGVVDVHPDGFYTDGSGREF